MKPGLALRKPYQKVTRTEIPGPYGHSEGNQVLRTLLGLELELELIQTHLTQKPTLRFEVGALGARHVTGVKGGLGRRSSLRRLCGCMWVF